VCCGPWSQASTLLLHNSAGGPALLLLRERDSRNKTAPGELSLRVEGAAPGLATCRSGPPAPALDQHTARREQMRSPGPQPKTDLKH
jgi:hypothetical protein